AAIEARAMAGGEGRGLVEKEQLGPAAPRHHLAAAAAEFEHTGEPGRCRPALVQQGSGRGIMDDAAIADKHSALGGGDDVAEWGDAVLQGHVVSPSPRPSRGEGRDEGLYPRAQCAESPPHPDCIFRCNPASPRKRGEARTHAAPSRIGGWKLSAVSQGKKIQVSCDTSVMKVSTRGRPLGLA